MTKKSLPIRERVGQRALLLVNRNARQGHPEEAASALDRVGIEVVQFAPASSKAVAEAIRRHRKQVDLVIVGGGDGSINAAASGLVETGLPLGIIPMGTANDLARTLNLPSDISEACAVIAAGKTRKIDVGQANDKYFFNAASVGLSARIAKALDKETKRSWGRLAYAKTAFVVSLTARSFHAEIRSAEGVTHLRALVVAVGNGRFYGGGMSVAPDASIEDGLLDLASIRCRNWWRLLWLASAIRLGHHFHSRDIRTMTGECFEIHTRHRMPVNADGEIVTHTPATFRVLSQAVTAIVP